MAGGPQLLHLYYLSWIQLPADPTEDKDLPLPPNTAGDCLRSHALLQLEHFQKFDGFLQIQSSLVITFTICQYSGSTASPLKLS